MNIGTFHTSYSTYSDFSSSSLPPQCAFSVSSVFNINNGTHTLASNNTTVHTFQSILGPSANEVSVFASNTFTFASSSFVSSSLCSLSSNSFTSASMASLLSLSNDSPPPPAPPSVLERTCTSKNLESCIEIESALDNLTTQMQANCSLSYDYFNRLINNIKGTDTNERIQAMKILRQSLAAKNAIKQPIILPKHSSVNSVSFSNNLSNNSFSFSSSYSSSSSLMLNNNDNGMEERSGPAFIYGENENINNANQMPSLSPSLLASPASSFSSSSVSSSSCALLEPDNKEELLLCDITIQDVLDANILKYIISALSPTPDNFHMQLEATLLLNRLTLGTTAQTKCICEHGCIPHLINLLPITRFAKTKILRDAIFSVLRNIAIDCASLRDTIIHTPGSIWTIVYACECCYDIYAVKLCHALILYNSLIYIAEILPIIEFLGKCIRLSKNPEVLCIACSACVTICEKQQGVTAIVQSYVIHDIVDLLKSNNPDVLFESLAVVAKIAYTGTTEQIDVLIKCGAVRSMVELLESRRLSTPCARARACNALGNIGCETPTQVQMLINFDAFPLLVDVFRNDTDYNTRIEAAYAVCAAASRANQQQVGYIVSCTSRDNSSGSVYTGECNCMQLIADMLELVKASDPMNAGSLKLCKAILRGLDNILSVGDEEGKNLGLAENPYAYMFKEVQGVMILSQMQFFPEYTVTTKTNAILDKYFTGNNNIYWSLR